MRRARRLPILMGTVALLLTGAYAVTAIHTPASDPGPFWTTLAFEGREAEQYTTLTEMARRADAVVVGRFASFAVGRVVQGDAAEDVVAYGRAELAIESVLAGEVPAAAVPVEFIMGEQLRPYDVTGARLATQLPDGRVVAFLRAKRARHEAGLWRLVNMSGLWTSTSRARLDTPLTEVRADGRFAADLDGITSLDAFADRVRLIGQGPRLAPTYG